MPEPNITRETVANLWEMFSIGWDGAMKSEALPVTEKQKKAAWREYLDRVKAERTSSTDN